MEKLTGELCAGEAASGGGEAAAVLPQRPAEAGRPRRAGRRHER